MTEAHLTKMIADAVNYETTWRLSLSFSNNYSKGILFHPSMDGIISIEEVSQGLEKLAKKIREDNNETP